MKKKSFRRTTNWLKKHSAPIINEVQVIGLGGAGCSTAKYLYENGFKAKYSCLTNEERTDLPPTFLFLEHHIFTKARSMHLILNRDKENNEVPLPDLDSTIPTKIAERIWDSNRIILLVGLGGLTGSFLVKKIADGLKHWKKEFTIVCFTPFSFEGEFAKTYANQLKNELASLPNFYCFSNEMLREKYGSLPIREAFKKGDEEVLKICKELFKE